MQLEHATRKKPRFGGLDRSCCFADRSVQGILLDPVVDNHKAHRFYERLGFVRVEERFFNDGRCYVYRLDRHLWKK
jgi:aminoglycoside 6'-N-acetyltransferase